ncbi:hypothetical protein QO011_007238 [Labrys wisconsinensis]|uniref:Uncharacterized protein n=1 Tax=Labrys wisconsinensis TaxID=425677 RepID=A0ABU0JIV0_9HYPH|nr:hypothetical protein [Labrys wisconsinensis]
MTFLQIMAMREDTATALAIGERWSGQAGLP